MHVPELLMRLHRAVSRIVLGKRLVALDLDCKARSAERKEALRLRVEALEKRAERAVSDAGLVKNGTR